MLRAIDVKTGEWRALVWSFLYFFCFLCAHYVLRPVRDEMGIVAGLENWLFMDVSRTMGRAAPCALFRHKDSR